MTNNPFRSGLRDRLTQAYRTENVSAFANALFGFIVDRYGDSFGSLKEDLKKARMDVLFRTYVSKMFLYSSIASIAGLLFGLSYITTGGLSAVQALRYLVGLPAGMFIVVFGFMYIYPSQKARRRKENIEKNLPFVMNHLSAVATSGIPPKSMFDLLQSFDEYDSISTEAGEISRKVNVFGEDLTTALRDVADTSPSEEWGDVLYGMISTIETGGELQGFIREKANEALFEFKIEKEKEIERLGTYASFYTAIMIAAPVFLVVILSIMNLLGGNILGFQIRDLMWLGIHIVIPLLNLGFIAFLVTRV